MSKKIMIYSDLTEYTTYNEITRQQDDWKCALDEMTNNKKSYLKF